jgi:aspartate/methionine/tyrosine aminotransferase
MTSRTGYALMRSPMHALPKQNIADLARWGFERTDVIPLWFGESDLTTPAFISKAAGRALADGHTFYTHQRGIPELREALSKYMGRLYRKPIGVDRITATSGGMAGILMSMEMLLQPDDNVVVVEPVWPNIQGAIHIMGGVRRSVMMETGNDGWRLDVRKVAAACDARTRAIFLASPGNPTGWMVTAEQQAALLDLARSRGLWIVSDEVYTRLVYDRPVAPSFLDIAEDEDPVIVINSFSKSWAMTGWRAGWLTHPPSIGETLAQVVQYNTSGTATFIQHAAVAAINEGEEFVASMRARCQKGRDIACDALERMPRVRLAKRPSGGMYVFFEVDGMTDSLAMCAKIFERTGVGLAPGSAFAEGCDNYLRACIALSPEKLDEAMKRVAPLLS